MKSGGVVPGFIAIGNDEQEHQAQHLSRQLFGFRSCGRQLSAQLAAEIPLTIVQVLNEIPVEVCEVLFVPQ
jgi:hypothetical protein